MINNRKVLYVARAGLPIDATGLRIAQIGKLFQEQGFDVHYICENHVDGSEAKNNYLPMTDKNLLDELDQNEVHFSLDGFIYSYLPRFSGKKIDAVCEMLELFTAKRIFKRICRAAEMEKPEYIVLYNGTASLAKRLIPYCKKRGIKIFGDVTEWYEKREKATLAERFIISSTNRRITKLDKKMDGIIAISPFFYDYYTKLGVKSVLIPPLMTPMAESELSPDKEIEPVRFVYAGSPGSKDIVMPFVEAVVRANRHGVKCRIDLVGIDLTYVQRNGCMAACPETGVYAHGRLPHDETVDIVKRADFGVLLRHDKRYAKAGFSTKFAECMSLGVGMICNSIGGTDLFIDNEQDGFLISSIEEEYLDAFLQKMAGLKTQDIIRIKLNALKKARETFTPEAYTNPFRYFLERGC